MAGYAAPDFSDATGLPWAGAAAPASTCVGTEGVGGFISAEADRRGSFATAVCRKCVLFFVVKSVSDRSLHETKG